MIAVSYRKLRWFRKREGTSHPLVLGSSHVAPLFVYSFESIIYEKQSVPPDMSVSNLHSTLSLIRNKSYCLWIGAGVTKHLTEGCSPSWEQLVEKLESEADLVSPEFDCSFTERLEIVRKKFGRALFQKALRKTLIIPLAESVIQQAKNFSNPFSIPIAANQIAKLGTMANSIVNFNIESMTSILLAKPGGSYMIKAFQPPVLGASSVHSSSGSYKDGQYRRSVYHPHGSIDMSGLCVLTETDYKAMHGTLAFQLACHAAFHEVLVIVGMSLEDVYLRKQIEDFRTQIRQIIWFVSDDPSDAIKKWAWKNSIEMIKVSWPEFWHAVDQTLSCQDEESLLRSWHYVVKRCFEMKNERHINPFADQGVNSVDWKIMYENKGLGGQLNSVDYIEPNEEETNLTLSFLKALSYHTDDHDIKNHSHTKKTPVDYSLQEEKNF